MEVQAAQGKPTMEKAVVASRKVGRTMSEGESLRASLLDEAKTIITGDRNNAYGPPSQDFARAAEMLTALKRHKLRDGERFEAHEIAEIITLVKLSRLQWTPTKRDSWTDIAGYAACGFEAAAGGTNQEDFDT